MLTQYRIEIKYGLIAFTLLCGLVILKQTQFFSGLDTLVGDFFDVMSGFGFVGIFIVAVIGNASLLMHLPYTVPLISIALGGASLRSMLWMGVASGLGASVGEIFSYGITLKLVGKNPILENSPLFQWMQRTVNLYPRLIGLLLFIYAVSPLPDDTVIIPLAMARYKLNWMMLPILCGKIVHNLILVTLFHYFTTWSANRVSATVQVDMALGSLILFVLVILYQVEKVHAIRPSFSTEGL